MSYTLHVCINMRISKELFIIALPKSYTMRLTTTQVQAIQNIFFLFFTKADKVWLFGSRVDDLKKGGDIDLYIETNYDNFLLVEEKKMQFVSKLKKNIGEQKIDVVINILPHGQQLPIYEEAKNTGVQLI